MAVALGAVAPASIEAVKDSFLKDVTKNLNHSTGGIVGQAWTFSSLDKVHYYAYHFV